MKTQPQKHANKISFTKFPDSKTLRLSVFFLVLSAVLTLLVVFLPDLFRQQYYKAAINSPRRFELPSFLSGGFAQTDRHGDTNYTHESTFQAYYILSKSLPLETSNPDEAKNYITKLEQREFGRDTQRIYEGIVILKALGMLTGELSEKYYSILLQLSEPQSGFRSNHLRSATVSATAYAFQAIIELGKFDEFKKTETFSSSLQFVASLRESPTSKHSTPSPEASNTTTTTHARYHNATTYGFRDSLNDEATLRSTWFAVFVLSQSDDYDFLTKALAALDKYVYSTQTIDGGFVDKSILTVEEIYYGRSTTASTAQAIYILQFLNSPELQAAVVVGGVEKYFEEKFGAPFKANSYLRSVISHRGVLASAFDPHVSLEATYYFLKLVERFPDIQFGTPRDLETVLLSLSFLFFLSAVIVFYRPQILAQGSDFVAAWSSFFSVAKWSSIYLVLGALSVKFLPQAAVFIYLFFAAHLFFTFLEMCKSDPQLEAPSVVLLNSVLYMVLVALFQFISVFIFAQISIFYALAAWSWASTFALSLVFYSKKDGMKLKFLFFAAFQSWACNTCYLFSYLYTKGDMDLVFRVLNAQGQFYVIFVVLPLVSLFFTYFFTAIVPFIVSPHEPRKLRLQ